MSKVFNDDELGDLIRRVVREELDEHRQFMYHEHAERAAIMQLDINNMYKLLTEFLRGVAADGPDLEVAPEPEGAHGAREEYYRDGDIHFIRIPVPLFRIRYHDKSKRAGTGNYFNLGFFAGGFSEVPADGGTPVKFTLPVANLVCDINEGTTDPIVLKYLKEGARSVVGGKMRFPGTSTVSDPLRGKSVSTLIVYEDGRVDVLKVPDVSGAGIAYAVSGCPIITKGARRALGGGVQARGLAERHYGCGVAYRAGAEN